MLDIRFYATGETGIDFRDETKFQLISVTGLDPVRAALQMATAVGEDGTSFISAKLNNRNIVATFAINGDIEANRQELYSAIRPKAPINVAVQAGSRSVTIEGYVESVSCNVFARSVRAQISVICPNPWFIGNTVSPQAYSQSNGFAFDVSNSCDSPAPFILNFRYQGSASVFQISCYKESGEAAGELNIFLDSALTAPDTITLDSRKKTLTYTPHGGEPVSLIGYIDANDAFFDLPLGESTLFVHISGPYDAADEFLEYKELWGGV